MYEKPQVVCFGTLRELTQIGVSSDCDGGVQGVRPTAVSTISPVACRRS